MKKIVIYTDGACSGNPGPGGWGSILMHEGHTKEVSGFMARTTNNIMELTAVIEALKLLKYPCETEVYSDSAYVINAFNNGWVDKWERNGWKTGGGDSVKNIELWKELISLAGIHKVKWIKVKGHSDNPFNNRCDELARAEIKKNASPENI